MNIIIKNNKYLLFVSCLYLGMIIAIFGIIFLDKKSVTPFSYMVMMLTFLVMFFGSLFSLPTISVELTSSTRGVNLKKWKFVNSKDIFISKEEIEKIHITFGTFEKTKLFVYRKNNPPIKFDMNDIDFFEGCNSALKLNQFAPNSKQLQIGLNIAKAVSDKLNIPFESEYILKAVE